jgi:hypothetical protein
MKSAWRCPKYYSLFREIWVTGAPSPAVAAASFIQVVVLTAQDVER